MSPHRMAGHATDGQLFPHPNITVARHETFHLRDGWLLKALNALSRDRLALSAADAHHQLGVGKNMLTAIRYWAQATGLAVPAGRKVKGRNPLSASQVATFILQYDPFLEDVATLWLVHIELASNANLATFWYWAFNEYEDVRFSENDLTAAFINYVCARGVPAPNERSVRKDVSVFLRTYRMSESRLSPMLEDSLDCPLASLGLLGSGGGMKPYAFIIGPKDSLPLELVAYAIFRYRDLYRPGVQVISLDELRWARRGPGRLLALDARTLMDLAEATEAQSGGEWLRVSHTAGLRNIHLGQTAPLESLRTYFEKDHRAAG